MGLRITGKPRITLAGRRDLHVQAALLGRQVRQTLEASSPGVNPIPAIKAAQEQFWMSQSAVRD